MFLVAIATISRDDIKGDEIVLKKVNKDLIEEKANFF